MMDQFVTFGDLLKIGSILLELASLVYIYYNHKHSNENHRDENKKQKQREQTVY